MTHKLIETAFIKIIPQDNPKQALRLRRFFMALAIYILAWSFAYFCYLTNIMDWESIYPCLIGIPLINIILYIVFRTGLNLRMPDPSLTSIQMSIAMLVVMYGIYYANEVRGFFLLLYVPILLFGIFRLHTRQFVLISIFALLTYGIDIALLHVFNHQRVNFKIEYFQWSVLAIVLVIFSFMGGYISSIRRHLSTSRAELEKTVSLVKAEMEERKKAQDVIQENEAKHRILFEAASDAIIIYREDKMIECNKAALKIFRANRDQFIGHRALDFIPKYQPDGRLSKEYIKETLALVLKGERYNTEFLYLRCDGTTFVGELAFDAIKINGVTYYQTIIRDITQRKEVEAEIKKLNTELEQRVIERTKELEFANKELESFSYSVSHDLRAPLRSIDGFSQILMEDFAGELSADASRYLTLVRTNAQQMAKLIADMLSFSRMSRQPLAKIEIKPEEIIRQVLEEFESMRKGRQIEINIGELPLCHADPVLLKVVFVNLLSNAVKFTGKKEKAVIEIGCYKKDGDNIYFVKDNGAGFDMKYVGKMFGVFQRLHRPDEFEGTGCGTAIIQRIINRHGGSVWVEAELNKGATFFFTLG